MYIIKINNIKVKLMLSIIALLSLNSRPIGQCICVVSEFSEIIRLPRIFNFQCSLYFNYNIL